MYIAMKALSVLARNYYGRWVSSMYIAMKARSVPARYYYGRRLSLRKQEGMDGDVAQSRISCSTGFELTNR